MKNNFSLTNEINNVPRDLKHLDLIVDKKKIICSKLIKQMKKRNYQNLLKILHLILLKLRILRLKKIHWKIYLLNW